MGQVDTTLRYRGYNSYKMDANERIRSDIFDVALYSKMIVQMAAIRLEGGTTGTVGIMFFDEQNKKIQYKLLKTLVVGTRWSEYFDVVEVPEGAMTAQLNITSGTDQYNWAVAMVAPGELPMAFSADLMQRVTLMNADSLYTGTITANQVITGVLLGLLGKAGFDLDKPEIWMDGADGSKWTASPENPLKITDADDNFIGGLTQIAAGLALIASAISNEEDPTVWLDVGSIADGSAYSDGLRLFHKAWSTAKGMFEVIPEGSTAIPTVLVKILENLCNIRAVDNPGISRARVIAALSSLSILADRTSDGESAAITIDGNRTYSNPSSGPVQTQMGLQMVSPKIGSTTRKIAIYAYDKNNVRTEIGIDADGPYKKVGTVRTAL